MHYGNIFKKNVIFVLWFYVLHECVVSADTILGDPYAILGVDRRATTQDIRRAYKKLVKEWCVWQLSDSICPQIMMYMNLLSLTCRHPDKNNDPSAEPRFVEINKAYDLLNDADRRKLYDNHGVTQEDAFTRNNYDYSHYGRFATDPFEEFFGFVFSFHFL